MRRRENEEIREAARKAGVKLWEVAEMLGMSGAQLSVLLRHELATRVRGKVMKAIEQAREQQARDEQG